MDQILPNITSDFGTEIKKLKRRVSSIEQKDYDDDQSIARKLDMYEVNTFADLEEFISDPDTGRCGILVVSDETYGGMPRLHIYTGTQLIQFVTYTE